MEKIYNIKYLVLIITIPYQNINIQDSDCSTGCPSKDRFLSRYLEYIISFLLSVPLSSHEIDGVRKEK